MGLLLPLFRVAPLWGSSLVDELGIGWWLRAKFSDFFCRPGERISMRILFVSRVVSSCRVMSSYRIVSSSSRVVSSCPVLVSFLVSSLHVVFLCIFLAEVGETRLQSGSWILSQYTV